MASNDIVAISRRLSWEICDSIGNILDAIKEEVKYIREENEELCLYRLYDVGIIKKNGCLYAKLYFSKSEKYRKTIIMS